MMSNGLCETCSSYQLSKLFSAKKIDVHLRWDVYTLQKRCEFCRLLGWMLARTDLSTIVCSTITGQARELESGQKGLFFLFESSNSKIAPVKCPYVVLPLATGYTALNGGYTHLARAAKSQHFDIDLAKEWLRECDGKHGIECRGSHLRSSRTELRLIDIEAQCIVAGSPTNKYAALSYVWGSVKPPVLRRENAYLLAMKGCLRGLPIPQAIVDTMTVCRQLGIRYLWVDSLCILQDDEDDVLDQVEHMDVIYRGAYLTIINTTGDNCKAPIASVSHPREAVQATTSIDGLAVGTVLLRVRDDILKSKWASRGWTLQEYALSYRSLIITPKGMFFSCSEGIRREDMTGYWTKSLSRPQRYMFPIVLDCAITNKVDTEVLRQVYAPLVTNFTGREVTYVEDILHAFKGITKALVPSLKRFEWGMPAQSPDHMQYSLCWSRIGPMERYEEYPSWAWAGWRAPAGEIDGSPHRGVQFLTSKQADAIQRMGDVYRPYKTEVSTVVHKGEYHARVDFMGRFNEMVHLKTHLAPINASTHQAFTEWLSTRKQNEEVKSTVYEFLSSSHVRDAKVWFDDATLCLLLADAADFLIALPVEQVDEDEVYRRVGNPIFLHPRVWEAYKPRAQELFLA